MNEKTPESNAIMGIIYDANHIETDKEHSEAFIKTVRSGIEKLERERNHYASTLNQIRDTICDALPDYNAPTNIMVQRIISERNEARREAEKWRDEYLTEVFISDSDLPWEK